MQIERHAQQRLRLQEQLGSGSYASVWRAELISGAAPELQVEAVAAKVLQVEDAGKDGHGSAQAAFRLFAREALIMASIQHRNIAKCFGLLHQPSMASTAGLAEACEQDGSNVQSNIWVMCLELATGGTLAKLLLKQMCSPFRRLYSDVQMLRWLTDIASALTYCHGLEPPLVHRDLKLENVLLQQEAGGDEMRVLLADFGLHVRLHRAKKAVLRQSVLGSPMGPAASATSMHSTSSVFLTPTAARCQGLEVPPAGVSTVSRTSSLDGRAMNGPAVAPPVLLQTPSWHRSLADASNASLSALLAAGLSVNEDTVVEEEEDGQQSLGDESLSLCQVGTSLSAPLARPLPSSQHTTNWPQQVAGPGTRPDSNGGMGVAAAKRHSIAGARAADTQAQTLHSAGRLQKGVKGVTGEYRPLLLAIPSAAERRSLRKAASANARAGLLSAAPPSASMPLSAMVSGPHTSSMGGGRSPREGSRGHASTPSTCPTLSTRASLPEPCVPEEQPPSGPGSKAYIIAVEPSRSAAASSPVAPCSQLSCTSVEAGASGAAGELQRRPSGFARPAAVAWRPLLEHAECRPVSDPAAFVALRADGAAGAPAPCARGALRDGSQSDLMRAASASQVMIKDVRMMVKTSSLSTRTDPPSGLSDLQPGTASYRAVRPPALQLGSPLNQTGALRSHPSHSHSQLQLSAPLSNVSMSTTMTELPQDFLPHVIVEEGACVDAAAMGASLCAAMKPLSKGDLAWVYSLTGQTGSHMYMAPEVYFNQPYNEKVDVFSFGVLAYELACRVLLYFSHVGTAAGPRGVQRPDEYACAVAGGYRPQRPPGMSDELWTLIQSCWHQDPNQRPSMADVHARLGLLLEREQVREQAQARAQAQAQHAAQQNTRDARQSASHMGAARATSPLQGQEEVIEQATGQAGDQQVAGRGYQQGCCSVM